jgi:hypothetical protein
MELCRRMLRRFLAVKNTGEMRDRVSAMAKKTSRRA